MDVNRSNARIGVFAVRHRGGVINSGISGQAVASDV